MSTYTVWVESQQVWLFGYEVEADNQEEAEAKALARHDFSEGDEDGQEYIGETDRFINAVVRSK